MSTKLACLLFICFIYPTVEKFGVGKIFLMFLTYAHKGCIYLVKNTIKTTVAYCEMLLKKMYSCNGKADFLAAITPVFSIT